MRFFGRDVFVPEETARELSRGPVHFNASLGLNGAPQLKAWGGSNGSHEGLAG